MSIELLLILFGHRLSHNNPKYTFDFYDTECQKLLNLNLDTIAEYILKFYSAGGHPVKNQAQILRSLILFVLLFNKTPAKTSLTTILMQDIKQLICIICNLYKFIKKYDTEVYNFFQKTAVLLYFLKNL